MSHLTILSHSSLRLAKLWKSDGTIASYDESKYYTVTQRHVSDVHDLSAALTELEGMTSHTWHLCGRCAGSYYRQGRVP
jgi:hypothetical protein